MHVIVQKSETWKFGFMKEYEYMVLVTDEIFSHIITSVICLENYTRSDLSGAFRKLFSLYNELREEYYELKGM